MLRSLVGSEMCIRDRSTAIFVLCQKIVYIIANLFAFVVMPEATSITLETRLGCENISTAFNTKLHIDSPAQQFLPASRWRRSRLSRFIIPTATIRTFFVCCSFVYTFDCLDSLRHRDANSMIYTVIRRTAVPLRQGNGVAAPEMLVINKMVAVQYNNNVPVSNVCGQIV